jgi:hypothetical protein
MIAGNVVGGLGETVIEEAEYLFADAPVWRRTLEASHP